MSSLRAVVSAASLGSRSLGVLSSKALRNGHALIPCKNSLTCEANFSTTDSHLSGEKDTNSERATGRNDSQDNQLSSQYEAGRAAIQQNQSAASRSDNFDEIFKASRRLFSPSFVRDCQYRIILWQKRLREAEKEGKPIDMDKILTDSFPDVVEFSLSPLALPEVRLSLLKILLSQEIDNRHLVHILTSTMRDSTQLPIGIVAEIVRLLSLAPPTELRLETRQALVSTVVNERWYEVGAKHLVFFMFQIDELFDIKTITQEQRQKTKEKKQELLKEMKKAQRASKAKFSASDKEKSLENSLYSSNITGTNKEGMKESESTTEEKTKETEEEKIPGGPVAPIVSVNMESRAINLTNEFKVKDLARIVSLLSRWNSRNEPLLNACLHRLSLADLSLFTANQLMGLLQAMATLNLHNSTLLDNLTQQLTSKLKSSTSPPAQVCAVLQSLSALRWTGALESEGETKTNNISGSLVTSCLSLLKGRLEKLTVKEAAATLTSLANLCVPPVDDWEKALVADLATLVLQGKSPWWGQIQCAWCLAVLQCLDAAILTKVLDPQFVEQAVLKVKESGNSSSALTSANKLAQVNMAARLEVKGYDGPVLTDEQLDVCTQTTNPSSEQKAAKNALVNTLRKFVDLMTYVNLNPILEKGVTVDALMCANIEGEVRPLAASEKSDASKSESKTELTFSLALQYIPFTGVNSPGERPTGQYQMSARHLSLLGYTPVQILYSDLKPSLSVLEKISNIKTRIKSAVRASSQVSAPETACSPPDNGEPSPISSPSIGVQDETPPKPS